MYLQVEWNITEDELVKEPTKEDLESFTMYVFYDEKTGAVKRITPIADNNPNPSIQVAYSEVKDILDGNESWDDYKVVFSPDQKIYLLTKISRNIEQLESISDVIFQVPFIVDTSFPLVYDTMNDFTFIQDYNDTCWKVHINGILANTLAGKNLDFDKVFEVYVTSFNDPNILYKTFRIPLNELVANYYYIIPFDKMDYDEIKVSLYTRKIFSKYQYIKTKI